MLRVDDFSVTNQRDNITARHIRAYINGRLRLLCINNIVVKNPAYRMGNHQICRTVFINSIMDMDLIGSRIGNQIIQTVGALNFNLPIILVSIFSDDHFKFIFFGNIGANRKLMTRIDQVVVKIVPDLGKAEKREECE